MPSQLPLHLTGIFLRVISQTIAAGNLVVGLVTVRPAHPDPPRILWAEDLLRYYRHEPHASRRGLAAPIHDQPQPGGGVAPSSGSVRPVTTPWSARPAPGPVASCHAALRGGAGEGGWHPKPD